MAITYFSSLSDIPLLEIFSYLSCEDALYAFADLHDHHLVDLLRERGAYYHICLSPQLSVEQYVCLRFDIWHYDLVRSLVCKEMFSDYISLVTPYPLFPSLTDLQLHFLRSPLEGVAQFVIAHASTLTHFILTTSDQSFIPKVYRTLLQTVLPHLNNLKILDAGCPSPVQVQ
jgi:hypothetical protein